jgi:type IV pilus assembly protein PilE
MLLMRHRVRGTRLKIPQSENGFTLIEVMVTVVIVTIIAAIALPGFKENVNRTRRVDAKGVLLENAQFMERFFTENSRYDFRVDGVTAVSLPFITSPRSGAADTQLYDVSLATGGNAVTAGSYTLQAVPTAGGAMANDACGTFLLNNFGVRSNLNNTKSTEECWSK